MPNTSALSAATTALVAFSNLVLVTPNDNLGYQPQNDPNPDGSPSLINTRPTLLFNYEGEQTVTLDSDITDHYVEDNTAVADQIALKPEMVTTKGYIGELNDVAPAFLAPLKFAADKLTTVVAYTPELTAAAQLAYAQALFLYQVAQNVANSSASILNLVPGFETQNKQQQMFQQFYGYWKTRTLFTVQTPWALFQDMAIKSLRAIQDAETRVITDFEVSFKKIRTASTSTVAGLAKLAEEAKQARAATQAAAEVNQGTTAGVNSIGLLQGLIAMGVLAAAAVGAGSES